MECWRIFQKMSKFYLQLWSLWALRVVLCTIAFATIFTTVVTLIIYAKQGFAPLNSDVVVALEKVFLFWFLIFVNLALLLALFRSTKYLFNRCYSGYMFKLKLCNHKEGEYIEAIGYGDLLRVWRKWFMLLIWIVSAMMLFAFIGSFFNIYVLYGAIILAGYPSFMILSARCKNVKVVKCSFS